jgi:flagellar hook-associated protein 1 FlgK
MSLTSLLSIARSALQAQERAVNVIGHNIANADTPGYTRQQVVLGAAIPETISGLGQVGRGVDVLGIQRVRSSFIDQNWRNETALQNQYDALHQALDQVSGVLGEPSDTGLSASIDQLIDSFQTLANNPVDPSARVVVANSAQQLVDTFHSFSSRITDVANNIGAQLNDAVTQANSYLSQIGTLNTQIRASGGQAPDLQDQRDQLIDQLSGLIGVQVLDRGEGTVDVIAGGVQLVSSGGSAQQLSVAGGGPYTVQVGSPPVTVPNVQGKMKGLIDAFTAIGAPATATTRATGLRGQLDDLALGIVSAVNQIHSDYDPTTKPLQPTLTPAPTPLRTVGAFFDPNGVTASTINLSAAIAASPDAIAAGWSTADGDNSIALRLGQLRTLAVPIPGGTAATPNSPAVTGGANKVLGDYYTGVVAGLGVMTRDADSRAASQAALVSNIDAQRQDASGVSIDEEMVKLIEHQQAYSAAARLIQAASDMMDELLNIGR